MPDPLIAVESLATGEGPVFPRLLCHLPFTPLAKVSMLG